MPSDGVQHTHHELRINRLTAVEADVVEAVVEGHSEAEYEWDGDLVIRPADEEIRREIADACRERASAQARMSDYEGAQWCQDAAYKVDDGVLDPVEG